MLDEEMTKAGAWIWESTAASMGLNREEVVRLHEEPDSPGPLPRRLIEPHDFVVLRLPHELASLRNQRQDRHLGLAPINSLG
jgi:hypothetical protein